MKDRQRCTWAGDDPMMRAYHDEEWGVPQHDSRMLWEMLMLEGFQAGLAWITVLKKRDAFRKAFAGFNPKKVAKFGRKDIDRLMGDAGIFQISRQMKRRGFTFVGPTIVYAWMQAVGIVNDHAAGCFRRAQV